MENELQGSVESSDAAPSGVAEGTEQAGNMSGAAPAGEAPLIDLDSTEKFKFEGKEWTKEQLRQAYLRHEDYTQKTQALAENRKFYENLPYDLDSVRKNPALANQFKSIYPRAFHRYLDNLGSGQPVEQQQQYQTSQSANQVDPVFLERFNRVEQQLLNSQVSAINAQLDAKFERFSKLYPYADEEAVVARAQYLVEKGEEMTDRVWDSLWKSSNERTQKVAEARYQSQLQAQKVANKKSKDVPGGGAIPASGVKMPRTIKEASLLALRELEGT